MQKEKRTRLTRKAIEESLNSKGLLTPSQLRKVYMHKKMHVRTEVSNEALHAKEEYQLSFEEFKQLYGHSSLRLVKYSSLSAAESLLKMEYNKAIWSAILTKKEGVHISALDNYRFRTYERKATLAYIRHFNINID
jgi:hypothetical protein